MKDILIGVIIIFVVFLIGDFIYAEKNTCIRNEKEIHFFHCLG